jgi:integrase
MSIRERNKGYQIDISHQGKRHRFNIKGDKSDALIAEQQIHQGLKIGKSFNQLISIIDAQRTQITVGSIFSKIKKNINSMREIQKASNVLLDLGQDLKITDLDEDLVDQMIELWRSRGNTDSTINRKQAVISKICSYALKKGYIKEKPEINWFKEGSGNYRFLKEEEQELMCNILRSGNHHSMVDLITVACDTGFRYSELLRINLNRDLDGDRLTCQATKNDTVRTIPLTKRSMEILVKRGNLPFNNITERYKRDAWDYARIKMGYADDPQFTFHCTRHTCASRLVQRGINIQVVQKWLGHKTINMTLRYAHLDDRNFIQGRNVLENISGDIKSDNYVSSR